MFAHVCVCANKHLHGSVLPFSTTIMRPDYVPFIFVSQPLSTVCSVKKILEGLAMNIFKRTEALFFV